ncbi:MAG: short-chain dehydrogenase, partial [Thermoleophilia bacterium]|nr:short-chain dehydrogenase [Thermoleophilia bacterium]
AYGRSKLANLLFTFELDRRLREQDATALAVACHPGYSATNLQSAGPGEGTLGLVLKPALKVANVFLAQSDEMGALPTLYAATAPDVVGGDYIGPDGIGQSRGHPTKVDCSSRARNTDDARRLWEVSVELTGVDYAALG